MASCCCREWILSLLELGDFPEVFGEGRRLKNGLSNSLPKIGPSAMAEKVTAGHTAGGTRQSYHCPHPAPPGSLLSCPGGGQQVDLSLQCVQEIQAHHPLVSPTEMEFVFLCNPFPSQQVTKLIDLLLELV